MDAGDLATVTDSGVRQFRFGLCGLLRYGDQELGQGAMPGVGAVDKIAMSGRRYPGSG